METTAAARLTNEFASRQKPGSRTMADIGEIQRKLDNDRALYRRFLTDPVGVLAAEGVVLNPQQAFELQYSIMTSARPVRNGAGGRARESRDG
jgi:hypothetical protein